MPVAAYLDGGGYFDSDVEPLSPDFSWAAASIGGSCLIEEASRSFL
jgi:hypothetical protein